MTPESDQSHAATGAQPSGATDERAAAVAVRDMFDEIAGRYDFLNHVLSANVDRFWWWRTARAFRHILIQKDARVLDLCCGTGDMALALRKQAPANASVYFGADFSHQMLRRGAAKFAGKGILAVEADALRLPFADNSFDLVVTAFGFRNLANYQSGLEEIRRVLSTNGEFGILDFSEPAGLFGKFYSFYFKNILPKIGAMISGSKAPYQYLPESVHRFPAPDEMIKEMRTAGFSEVSWKAYSFGIAGLYRGKKR